MRMLARAALVAVLLLATGCTTSGPRPETVLASGQAGPSALATDGTHLYWTNTTGGELMVRQLKRRTAKTLELQSLNPDHADRTLAADDVEWIARIVWVTQ